MARRKGHWQSERCTVCSHPKIGMINFALARGTSPLAVRPALWQKEKLEIYFKTSNNFSEIQ
jgi:hypothetical protein